MFSCLMDAMHGQNHDGDVQVRTEIMGPPYMCYSMGASDSCVSITHEYQ